MSNPKRSTLLPPGPGVQALRPMLGADLDVLVRNFAQSTPELIEKLYDLAINNDTSSLLTLAELLQSSSINLGLQPVSEACERLRSVARGGDIANSMMAVGKVEHEFRKAREAIETKQWSPPKPPDQRIKRY